MSVYKEPLEWLRLSIDSILNQTFTDFEFIIICDNPQYNDGISLLNEYAGQDNRVKLLFNEVNIGLTKSLNIGLTIARGKYIARMDADDIALDNRFEVQMDEFLKQENLGVCGACVECFGTINKIRIFPETKEKMFLFVENCFAHSTIIAKRELMIKYKYNEECKHAQDYELWFRMYNDGVKFYNVPKVLLKYRTSEQQIGANFKGSQDAVGRHIRRASLVNYIRNNCGEFNFITDNVTKEDINKICHILAQSESYYQKLLFYLAISVDKKIDRLYLALFIIPIYHLSLRYYFHLCYYYLRNKRVRLF